MKILLTNDDGISSEGIRALARALGNEHSVTVVAPDSERSACGHSISIMKPLKLEEVSVEGAEHAYAFGGTPVDCVKFAWVKLGLRPDLVLSGINRGSNLGTDTIYSGTVAAAREAATLGMPSIAVSDVARETSDFAADAAFVAERLDFLTGLSFKDALYNINFPMFPRSEWKGFAPCRTGINIYEENFDLTGGSYYLSGKPVPHVGEEKCDTDYILEGYVTISPLTVNFTNERELGVLRSVFGGKNE